jgi:hypothetical protein
VCGELLLIARLNNSPTHGNRPKALRSRESGLIYWGGGSNLHVRPSVDRGASHARATANFDFWVHEPFRRKHTDAVMGLIDAKVTNQSTVFRVFSARLSTISACLERISSCFEPACKVDRLRAGTLGKEPARDARGGERESNCGAARRCACPTPPASQSRLPLSVCFLVRSTNLDRHARFRAVRE